MQTARSLLLTPVLAGLLAVACGPSDIGPSNPAYKSGELGNGGFVMACDDDIACRGETNDAAKFPSAIATGSTFRVRYVPINATETNIRIDETGIEGSFQTTGARGSIVPVGDSFISKSPNGLLAKVPGLGVIMAKNAGGAILDYTTVNIVDADALAVYENANLTGSGNPTKLTAKTLATGETVEVRAVARRASENLAGSFGSDWTSDKPDVVAVETIDSSHATLRAVGVGKATITAEGRGLSSTFTVEVTQ